MLGISVDSPFANGAYAIELGLEFPLLGDFPWGRTGKAWGILNEERGFTSRMTYVIDSDGVVRHIIDAPATSTPTPKAHSTSSSRWMPDTHTHDGGGAGPA